MLYPIQNEIRNRFDLSGIWDFQIDPDETGEESGWQTCLPQPRPMAVPGSWNEQYEDLFNYFGLGWYLRWSYVSQSWHRQRVYLRVGSANYAATVYVNGLKIGSHEGGHLPFAFEITDKIRWGEENLFAISVENHLRPERVPSANVEGDLDANSVTKGFPSTTFDFFPFAGLHRPVVLYSVPQMAIEDLTVVTEIKGSEGIVHLRARINGPEREGRLILRGNGRVLEAPFQFDGGAGEASLTVPAARFWSDQDPYLYRLTLLTETDCYSLDIGIRTVEVKGKQFLLNGQPVQLNGFGRHEDFFASGKGLNLPLMVKDYQLMRWTGANSYRTSHYPYSEEEMMLADREGFLIIDETPAVSLQFGDEANIAERQRICLQQIDELIARDKNHPSVVMWSVANEPMLPDILAHYTGKDKHAARLAQAGKDSLAKMMRHARQLDPTRPVTFVGMMGSPLDWQEECDVVCMNRYWGWYLRGGELQDAFAMIDQELDDTWEMLGKPIIVSEFGADTMPGLHGHPAVMWTEEYQAEMIRGYLEAAAKKDFVIGMQVWNFADFAAVQSTMRVGGMNMKGVFTRARQPKMAAHVLREFWTRVRSPIQHEEPLPEVEKPQDALGSAQETLEEMARKLDGKKPDLTSTLKFDFYTEGIFRLLIQKGACRVEPGDGEADAAVRLKWKDAQKLFSGKMDPMVAMLTGKIKTSGDVKALMILQSIR